jgi:sporulation protein YlmC with PRC-barrel domain
MPHYGILRDHKLEDVDDLRGADVYGVNDEKLGTIDDVIFDHSSGDIRYIVLKTGGLLSRKKVMVPANRVEPYGNHDDKFYAELDKERLEMLPEFHDDTLKTKSNWSRFEREHNKRWHDGAAMYNRNTGRIITPPPEDVEIMRRERETREVMNPVGEELEFQSEEPGSRSQAIGEPGVYKLDPIVETEQGAGPTERQALDRGRRWNDFQQNLRSRRKKIVVDCPDCASQDKAA